MNVPVTEPPILQPPGAGIKFAYASGSRPLEGYTIKRGIGRGGFGEVYYATSDAGKEVALKLIRRNLDIEIRGVTQCLNLKHPHLVALHDIRQDAQDDSWVIMEYVAGECLEDAIARHPQGMPASEALCWIHGVAAAVAYLHDHGIVHRDLKPGNIFSDEGLVKVGDYGLSKFISCSRRSGQTGSVGTVHYMAPEVANGRYGKEIDVYALGIILYEMLTGRVPFEGESVGEILMKHLTAEVDVASLEEPFRSIVRRALAKDPASRVGSAGEFIALLPTTGTPSAFNPGPSFASAQAASPSILPAGAERLGGASPVRTAAMVPGEEEPVWRAIRGQWRAMQAWWDANTFSGPQKALILIAALLILPPTAGVWMPAVFFSVVAYFIYRAARLVFLALGPGTPMNGQARPPAVAGEARAAPPAVYVSDRPSPTLRRWREQPAAAEIVTTPREKLTELTGSLLSSAAVAAIVSLMVLIVRGQPFEANQFAFLALLSTIGAWGIMIPAKLWEGSRGDPVLRRFVMMVFGLGIGAIGYLAQSQLLVRLPFDMVDFAQPRFRFPRGFFSADGSPLLLAFVSYFGFLYLIPKWWRQADPLRSQRLSVWSTLVCVFWASAVGFFWPFPQPWGLMLAATISIAVQLASPWHKRTIRRGKCRPE